jgi:hypothetical protein
MRLPRDMAFANIPTGNHGGHVWELPWMALYAISSKNPRLPGDLSSDWITGQKEALIAGS